MVLVCHVISNDHVIRGSSNFMGRSLSRKVFVFPSLVTIGTVIVEIYRF